VFSCQGFLAALLASRKVGVVRDQYNKKNGVDRRDRPSEIPAWFRRMLNRDLREKTKQAMRECVDWDSFVPPLPTRNACWLWW